MNFFAKKFAGQPAAPPLLPNIISVCAFLRIFQRDNAEYAVSINIPKGMTLNTAYLLTFQKE